LTRTADFVGHYAKMFYVAKRILVDQYITTSLFIVQFDHIPVVDAVPETLSMTIAECVPNIPCVVLGSLGIAQMLCAKSKFEIEE
jgi:hypothetical protein